MNIKISFHNMSHSQPMEDHAQEKLQKIVEICGTDQSPLNIELWLKANKLHPHHSAELHVKTAKFNLNAHDEGTDMYIVIDNTIDKMVGLLKKDKERSREKYHKPETEKKNFSR